MKLARNVSCEWEWGTQRGEKAAVEGGCPLTYCQRGGLQDAEGKGGVVDSGNDAAPGRRAGPVCVERND